MVKCSNLTVFFLRLQHRVLPAPTTYLSIFHSYLSKILCSTSDLLRGETKWVERKTPKWDLRGNMNMHASPRGPRMLSFDLSNGLSDQQSFNSFMHNVVKWPKKKKKCGIHTARFLKYVWPFYNIMHERVKLPFFSVTHSLHWLNRHGVNLFENIYRHMKMKKP